MALASDIFTSSTASTPHGANNWNKIIEKPIMELIHIYYLKPALKTFNIKKTHTKTGYLHKLENVKRWNAE